MLIDKFNLTIHTISLELFRSVLIKFVKKDRDRIKEIEIEIERERKRMTEQIDYKFDYN